MRISAVNCYSVVATGQQILKGYSRDLGFDQNTCGIRENVNGIRDWQINRYSGWWLQVSRNKWTREQHWISGVWVANQSLRKTTLRAEATFSGYELSCYYSHASSYRENVASSQSSEKHYPLFKYVHCLSMYVIISIKVWRTLYPFPYINYETVQYITLCFTTIIDVSREQAELFAVSTSCPLVITYLFICLLYF